jgi:hypothetical protein
MVDTDLTAIASIGRTVKSWKISGLLIRIHFVVVILLHTRLNKVVESGRAA